MDSCKKAVRHIANSSFGVCIAYSAARCTGAYLSLRAITTIPHGELGILALCYSALWWVSIVTAGGIRTALIARSVSDPLRTALYDNHAVLWWHFCSIGALGIAFIVHYWGYHESALCGALLWCYIGALWSDWFFAIAARSRDNARQSSLFLGGACMQLIVAHLCIPMFGFIGALYAQGSFYWGAVVAHGQYRSLIPRRCSLQYFMAYLGDSFSYMPALLYSWMTASATRMILLFLYGTKAVGVWSAVELVISPVITATSTMLSLLYLPRLLRGDFGLKYPADHPLIIVFCGSVVALFAYLSGIAQEIVYAIFYTAALIASMAMTLWSYRANASLYERALPCIFAFCQTATAAVLWIKGGVVFVLIGQSSVLIIGMILYGFFIGARICDSSIYSILRRRPVRVCD